MSAWAKRRMTRRNFWTLVTQSMPAMVNSRKQVRVTLPDVKNIKINKIISSLESIPNRRRGVAVVLQCSCSALLQSRNQTHYS